MNSLTIAQQCRVVKQADTPPCLGGGEYGKYSLLC
ncbi:hypothetical protein ACVWYG_001510 [Pedobacter sp. UYEF25]